MAHKVFFVFSVIALIGFTVDIFVPQHEYVFLFSACASAPGLIAAKWSIYTPEWRWSGIVNAPAKVTLVWRWGMRLLVVTIVCLGFWGALSSSEKIKALDAKGKERLGMVVGDVMGIVFNLWYCGFFLFGDRTVSSGRFRN